MNGFHSNLQSRFVIANGLRLHYLDSGDETLPALVCLHGLNGNAHAFDQIAPMFEQDYRIVSLDLGGHGDSEWRRGAAYSIPVYLRDFEEFLDAIGIAKLSLVGSSLGGLIAMLLAASQPERVERLVLNDIGPEINPDGLRNAASRPGLAGVEFKTFSEAVEHYRNSYPPAATLADSVVAELVRNSVRSTQDGSLRWKTDPAVSAAARFPGSRSAPAPLWCLYDRVQAPVLIVRGQESDILSRSTVARMRSVLPFSRSVEVPGVGHTPWLSEPEATRAMWDFLRRWDVSAVTEFDRDTRQASLPFAARA